jgi:hypothetical protein
VRLTTAAGRRTARTSPPGAEELDLGCHSHRDVANLASYAISSSLILLIHDNMINGTNHIVQLVFVDISRSQGCQNITCQIEKIVYISRVKNEKEKKTERKRKDTIG